MTLKLLNKTCPFYWSEGQVRNERTINPKTRQCLLKQAKSMEQGEPGCVYHGSMPPVCDCQGKYEFTDMIKIGKMLWECPFCQEKVKGEKNCYGYNEYDYSNKGKKGWEK